MSINTELTRMLGVADLMGRNRAASTLTRDPQQEFKAQSRASDLNERLRNMQSEFNIRLAANGIDSESL